MYRDFTGSICVYGAGVLLKHVDALGLEIEGVQNGAEDIEFIHRARVASRRLRSAFPLFEDCLPRKKKLEWLKQIKKVTQALGAARDTDVQIEVLQNFAQSTTVARFQPGIKRLMLRLDQKRKSLQPAVEKAMQDLIASQVLTEMQERLHPLADQQEKVYLYTPALYQHAFQAIDIHLTTFLNYEEIVNQPEKVKELHEMRISAKWLRYTMENMASLYAGELKNEIQVIRKVQDGLGSIHDCDVWMQFLPCFLEEERQRTVDYLGNARSFGRLALGIQQFLQERQQERNQIYEEFVRDWQNWEEQGIWRTLRQRIRAPFFESIPVAEAPASPLAPPEQ